MSQTTSMPVAKLRAWTNALDLRLRRSKGVAFQEFFAAVMTKAHGGNYVPASSAYSHGDISCDGLLSEPLTIYACYGPVDGGTGQVAPTIKKAVAKVTSDHDGALQHWPDLKSWVFVTNYVEGTPPLISKEILRLDALAQTRSVVQFGKAQFEETIFKLDVDQIELLLGNDATDADFRSLQMKDVLTVVDGIVTSNPGTLKASDDIPKVISPKKLEFNRLPPAYVDQLNRGFTNSAAVATLLLDHPDPTLDSRLATIFRNQYDDLASQGLSPGSIMDKLYAFAQGERPYSVPLDVAVFSLLAHLFEKCTIFEDAPVEDAP